MSKENK